MHLMGASTAGAPVVSSAAMSPRALPAIVLALAFALPAHAQDLVGPRGAGMGDAARGLPATNDALYLNPAGLALYPRYSVEFFWRRRTETNSNLFSASIVDSKSGAVAGGLAYTWDSVGEGGRIRRGSRVDVGSAYHVASFLLMGATLHWIAMGTDEGDLNRVTGDAGFLFLLGQGLTVGLTATNVLNPTDQADTAPRLFGAGVGLNLMGSLSLSMDWRQSFEREGAPWSWYLGAEYFALGAFPLRAGYVIDEITGERRWTAGLGYIDQGFGLDLAYSHTVSDTGPEQYLTMGFRLFL